MLAAAPGALLPVSPPRATGRVLPQSPRLLQVLDASPTPAWQLVFCSSWKMLSWQIKKNKISGENAQRHVAGTKRGRGTPGDAGAGIHSAHFGHILRTPAHPQCLLRGDASCRSAPQQRLNFSSSRIFPSVRIWG